MSLDAEGGTQSSASRVGLFGGAFDPPHCAHVALVHAAISHLHLDVLHVVPTGQAWHKARTLSPASDRLAMCRAAFGDIDGVQVDDRELRRLGPSYTLDTLHELCALHPTAELYLLLGGDQAAAFQSWSHWRDIAEFAIISIAHRVGTTCAEDQFGIENWPGARVRRLPLPDMPLSATAIRQRLAAGLPVDDVVPAGVARYIDQHFLYRTAR